VANSTFKEQVILIVKQIPYGKVASYGQIALYAQSPRAARQVGWILNKYSGAEEIPWWRVVNNSGRISIKGSHFTQMDQKLRLENEGVIIDDNLSFDINQYRWHK
jgi:methylated-DNA-protein-cysteine methyltransferase-like protein